MYFSEILWTTFSLLNYSVLLVSTSNTRLQGLGLVVTSCIAISASVADLSFRNEPIKQRAVYQIMHLCFLVCGLLQINHRKHAIVMLGVVLVACGILLQAQVSNYTRLLVIMTGFTALVTKDDHETAYALAVSAVAFTQDQSNDELAYALIWLSVYPLMILAVTFFK